LDIPFGGKVALYLHLECDRERRTISINFLSNSDARVRNRWF